jgi:hypothetical protein
MSGRDPTPSEAAYGKAMAVAAYDHAAEMNAPTSTGIRGSPGN